MAGAGAASTPHGDDASAAPTVRLWHTAGVLATLPTATTPPSGFSVTNLLGALVFVLLFWLFQRWLRDRVSTRRRERWAREEGRAPETLDETRRSSGGEPGTDRTDVTDDTRGPDASGADASGPEDPTRR